MPTLLMSLSSTDYMAEFKSLIPLLQEEWGERFHSAIIRHWTYDGMVTSLACDGTTTTRQDQFRGYPRTIVSVFVTKGPNVLSVYAYQVCRSGIEKSSSPNNRAPIQEWIERISTQKMARFWFARIKEELMAAAWAPERVERLLTAGGFDALD